MEEPFAMTADFSEEQFDRSIALNLRSVWLCMKAEIRRMLAQQPPGGAIVNTSSINGLAVCLIAKKRNWSSASRASMTGPFTMVAPFEITHEPGYQIFEYACPEGLRDAELEPKSRPPANRVRLRTYT